MLDLRKGLKIVSNNTREGTEIIDLNTGKAIPRVLSVDIHMSAEGQTTASLLVAIDEVNIILGEPWTRVEKYENTERDDRETSSSINRGSS